MSYDNLKKQYTKEHFWFCEIEVNGETYSFCENRSPLPVGINSVPSMVSQKTTPAKIDMEGGIGVRASASVTIDESQDYSVYGTTDSPVPFWANWRARNPNYQGGRLSLFSGYLDGKKFNLNNFTRRDYVIESFSMNEAGVSISAKDSLKLASNEKAKVPKKSLGRLSADITDIPQSITLLPVGIGDLEYPASGFARMGEEIVAFTRTGDDFSIDRGEYNTEPEAHSLDDQFQLCKEYNATVTDIIYDILVNFSSVDPSQIDKDAWDLESGIYLPSLYSALITEPTGATTLLKELSQSIPHYLYYNDRDNEIKFVAIKEPEGALFTYNDNDHLLAGSVKIKDRPDLRVSTVIVNYGQKDPTKPIDEVSNYDLGYVRITPNSITKYNDIQSYKVVNSRWIDGFGGVQARRLAAKWGRRFEDMPREISFSLDPKDSDVWTGDLANINTSIVLDEFGDRVDLPVQIMTAAESNDFNYTAIENTYGVELAEDLGVENTLARPVYIESDRFDINLREIYNTRFADIQPGYEVTFYIVSSAKVGGEVAIDTGAWPELTNPIKIINTGLISGKGGDGGGGNNGNASNGGIALVLNADIVLDNQGTIAAGGGGGGSGFIYNGPNDFKYVGGGGGAGFPVGIGGTSTNSSGTATAQAPDGTLTTGSAGLSSDSTDGGTGGDRAFDGTDGDIGGAAELPVEWDGIQEKGLASNAIEQNGFTITYDNTGTIVGNVIP